MKIVHLSIGSWPPVFTMLGGAIQRRVAELSQAQQARGHDVVVFSPGEEDRRTEVNGVEVRYLSTRTRHPWRRLEYQIRALAEVRRSYRDADVLHFHSEPEGALLSRGLGALTMLSYDNYYFRGGRDSRLYPIYRKALRAFDLLLPCSAYCEQASASYWDLPSGLTRVLVNGVNTMQFHPDREAAEQERQRLKPRGKVIIYLGRVCRQKGTDTLLRAYQTLDGAAGETTLLIAGPIDQFGNVKASGDDEAWRTAMREGGAEYLGAVHEDRLVGLLGLADLFVMPTVDLEMFGMAAVEAQACGTPVVASDHGGLREVVPPEVGLRFPPGDADALAREMARLLCDNDLRGRMALAATANAERYAWTRVAADFDAICAGLGSRTRAAT